MDVKIEIVLASREHIPTIARRMRPADKAEVRAAAGHSPRAALEFSLLRSSWACTALVDGRPEVMFGVADLNILAGVGAPWLLGTKAVETHSVIFLKESRHWHEQLFRRYNVLMNFVDARNTVSKRWLEWLGFKFFDPVQMNGYDFIPFEMRRADV